MIILQKKRNMKRFSVAILVISDSVSSNESEDQTTKKLVQYLNAFDDFTVVAKSVVPDSTDSIKTVLLKWAEKEKIQLILTSGGTGFSKRDITPEVVKSLISKETPGITQAMLNKSLQITQFAICSRPVSGICDQSLIITLPGSPKGAIENLDALMNGLSHALTQISMESSRQLHRGTHAHHLTSDGHGLTRHKLTVSLSKSVVDRPRESPFPMIPVDEALNLINNQTPISRVVSKRIDDFDITGHVLAHDIRAPTNVPNFRASIVDGYAVVHTDGPGVYRVGQISHASSSEALKLQSGMIARVTTGAPLPEGATAVVPVEETGIVSTKGDGMEEDEVEIYALNVAEGDNVREKGSDITQGSLALKKYTRISANGGEIGLLTSIGILEVEVFSKPVIGVLSTGDEVVELNHSNQQLRYGEIFDTNRPLLLQTLRNWGYKVVDLGIQRDSADGLFNTMHRALYDEKVDYLVTTGGVSMGELDLLKPIIEQRLAGVIHFGRVAMKPGKPTTFATIGDDDQKKLIFALPGNPASASVTAYLFLLPSLRKFGGETCYEPESGKRQLCSLPRVTVKLAEDTKLDPRQEYQRVHVFAEGVEGTLVAVRTGFQRSSRVGSVSGANALAILPSSIGRESKMLPRGSSVVALLLWT